MSLDLNKLADKLDEALNNETTETLTKFLTDKRMSNNKQSSIEWLKDEISIHLNFDQRLYLKELFEQAKEMHKQEMKEMYLRGIKNYDPTFKIKDNEIFNNDGTK